MSLKQNLHALTGNTVKIQFGQTTVGYLQNFSAQEDYGSQPLGGIGDPHPIEWVPGMQLITITADRAVLRKSSLMDILDKQATQTNGAFDNIDGLLQGYVFDVLVMQNTPSSGNQSTNLRQYTDCTLAASSMQVSRNQIILQNVTLHPIRVNYNLSGTGGTDPTNPDTNTGNDSSAP